MRSSSSAAVWQVSRRCWRCATWARTGSTSRSSPATPDFIYRPMTVAEPFTHQPAEQNALAPIAAEMGASFVLGESARVLSDEHAIELSDGTRLGYDALVLCIGGRARPAYAGAARSTLPASSWTSTNSSTRRRHSRLAFVVPPGVTWPLPIYELALMADRRARVTGRQAPQCVVVTPEAAPLIMFGQSVSDAVAGILNARGIELQAGTFARESEQGDLVLSPGDGILDATRTSLSRSSKALISRACHPTTRDSCRSTNTHGYAVSRMSTPLETGRISRSSRVASRPSRRTPRRRTSPPERERASRPSHSARFCAASF